MTPAATDARAAPRKAHIQPWALNRGSRKVAEATCPSCPSNPASCVRTGTRDGANHSGMSRSTDPYMQASPIPSRMRAAKARGRESAKAMITCAATITPEPVIITTRDP